MVWQAVIDDSGNEPTQHAYILGGFIGRYEAWSELTAAWQAELDAAPPIGTFKYTQARALKGPWTDFSEDERDARLLRFASLAKTHASFFIHAGIKHAHFQNLIQPVPVPERTLIHDHPYLLLIGRIAALITQIATFENLEGPVDCIADVQNGFEQEAFDWWNSWRAVLLNEKTGERVLGDLNFKTEQEFLPLQAADLAAGASRHFEMTGNNTAEFQKICELPWLDAHYKGEEARSMGLRMLRKASEVAANNPGLELQAYEATTAARLRRKNRQLKARAAKAAKDESSA